ncbi:MAG: hypothetical protein JSW60_07575 [Thermoplasmatales archaeon]|nr:MAG: hypothetical protein JSW60_07575 [Thermoplasmatales archaeon]
MKKSNLILGLLAIAFFIISLSLVLDIQTPSPTIPTPPTIIEIEEHRNASITHGGDEWPLGCVDCHYQPIDGECTDCHIPDYWLGDDDATYFAHHDLSYSGFMDCWSPDCHNPEPNDVRYVDTDLVEGDNWHEYCDTCHDDSTHDWPTP